MTASKAIHYNNVTVQNHLQNACLVYTSVFQALGNGVYSLIVSVARQLLVLLPSAWILAEAFGLHAVWWSFPIAEIASILLSVVLFLKIYRQKIQKMCIRDSCT